MAIIQIPEGIIVSNVEIEHNIPQWVTTSLSLKHTTKDRGIHQLKGSLDITLENERMIKKYESFITKVKGRGNIFTFEIGGRFSASSHLRREPILSTNADVGAKQVSIKALAGEIWDGDFVQFPNDKKIYIIQNDHKGDGVIDIYPALKVKQQMNAQLQMKSVKMYAYFVSDIQKIVYTEGGKIGTATITFEEAL